MSIVSPKPIIAHTLKSWRVSPGMTFAVVEDIENRIWVVQSCPVGTQFWTLKQAEELPKGTHTGRTLSEAILLGHNQEALQKKSAEKTAPPKEEEIYTRRVRTMRNRSARINAKKILSVPVAKAMMIA